MIHKIILFCLLGIDALILTFQTSQLSISYYEASILYGELSFLQIIIKSSIYLFGQNDFALRLPMILFHLLSILLLYTISKEYIERNHNRLWLVFIFALLPGVISSALVVNSAGIIIFFLFFFVYVFQNFNEKYLYILLMIYSIIDASFLYLFIALIVYSIHFKNKKLLLLNFILIFVSIYIFGTGIGGTPKGHFLDTIGLYSAVFSPIIFVYIVYILYRKILVKKADILLFISTSALIISFILSFRQKIAIEDFAPYLMLALPLVVQTFYNSYRVRLHLFRKNYRLIFVLSIGFLFINTMIVMVNKEIYMYIEQPKKHFAYNMHVAKDLAEKLHKRNIDCLISDKKMALRLQFYGIDKCDDFRLEQITVNEIDKNSVTVRYKNKYIYQASVTKIYK